MLVPVNIFVITCRPFVLRILTSHAPEFTGFSMVTWFFAGLGKRANPVRSLFAADSSAHDASTSAGLLHPSAFPLMSMVPFGFAR